LAGLCQAAVALGICRRDRLFWKRLLGDPLLIAFGSVGQRGQLARRVAGELHDGALACVDGGCVTRSPCALAASSRTCSVAVALGVVLMD
jgi:hypothetical protein